MRYIFGAGKVASEMSRPLNGLFRRTFIGKRTTTGCEKTQRTPRDLLKHENELPRPLRTRLFVGLWREFADRYSTAVSRSYIQGEPLFEIEYSDQLLIRLLEAYNPEKYGRRVEQINLMDIDPDKLTPAQLDKIAEHLIQKALAGKPEAMVAEARRRLEAGETVTVEAIETTSEAT